MSQNEDFYFTKEEPHKSCLLALRSIILQQGQEITETKKYGMPCFCYIKKAFVYLWVDKKTSEPYILFVEGEHLKNPILEKGKRSRMKILRINPNEDIDVITVSTLLLEALNLSKKES